MSLKYLAPSLLMALAPPTWAADVDRLPDWEAQAYALIKPAAKEVRWEGVIIRSDKDKSTLTVRKVGSAIEKIVVYDSSTKWVSQEHGSKTVNDIDPSQVKDNDRVICKGTYDKDGVLHATLISKRLSH